VITTAWGQGRRLEVFADETRPLFQGARLTAWELVQRGIPVTVLVDAAAGQLLRSGRVAACIVGADRITARGDVANKIGTYPLAILAHAHGVPFYVAAPSSTFDLALDDGADIPIEERAAAEVLRPLGVPAAPEGARAFNPAFGSGTIWPRRPQRNALSLESNQFPARSQRCPFLSYFPLFTHPGREGFPVSCEPALMTSGGRDAGAQASSSERRPGWPQQTSGERDTGSPVRWRCVHAVSGGSYTALSA